MTRPTECEGKSCKISSSFSDVQSALVIEDFITNSTINSNDIRSIVNKRSKLSLSQFGFTSVSKNDNTKTNNSIVSDKNNTKNIVITNSISLNGTINETQDTRTKKVGKNIINNQRVINDPTITIVTARTNVGNISLKNSKEIEPSK